MKNDITLKIRYLIQICLGIFYLLNAFLCSAQDTLKNNNTDLRFENAKIIELTGMVYLRDTIFHRSIPLAGSTVVLMDKSINHKYTTTTNRKGFYTFILDRNTEYSILAKKEWIFLIQIKKISRPKI